MDHKTTPALQIYLFGKPRILLAGEPQEALLLKAQALLYYLACSPQSHSRASLAALLWSEFSESKARTNLRTVLSRLQKDFGAYISATRSSIALDPQNPYWLDVRTFEGNLSSPSQARQRQGLNLYKGDFMGDFYMRGAVAFEEWVVIERERLRQLALAGLERMANTACEQGDLSQAILDFRQLILLDPWRESAHRELIRLLAQTGDRTASLAQYEACQQILETELGVKPAPATLALYEQVRDGAFELSLADMVEPGLRMPLESRRVPDNLPAATTSFHGRSQELTQIQNLIAEPGCRMLTLSGLGGVGKTRLMLEAGRQIVESAQSIFSDGVFWVPLAAVDSLDPMTSAIADALQISFSGRQTPRDQLFSYLSHKKCLLLLDNLEHLIEHTTYFSDLLHVAPGLKYLVTSRERLNLYEEWVLAVDGLPFPQTDQQPLERIESYDALQLFKQRARRVNLTFDLAKELEGVIQICRLVEGNPLGIELAASWTLAFDPGDIAVAIQQNLYEIDAQLKNIPERHRSLQATFDYSWKLLTQKEREVLAGLAVFRGGFTRESANLVSGSTDRILLTLAEKSLIRRVSTRRYELHEQLRQFSWQKLQLKEQDRVTAQHRDYYADLAQQWQSAIKSQAQEHTLQTIREDIENIRVAWINAGTVAQIQARLQMADTLFNYYMKTGLQQEGFRVFGEALAQAEAFEDTESNQGQALLLGKLLVYQGRCGEFTSQSFDQPQALLERGLQLSRQHTEYEDMTQALFGLGLLGLIQGDFQRAADYLGECQEICRAEQIPWTLADTLNMSAWIANHQGDPDHALAICQEALSIKRNIRDISGIASVLTTLGIIRSNQGEHQQAEQAYAEALDLCRQSGQRVGAAQALTGLFGASFRQGKTDQAAAYAQESLAVNRDAGDRLGEAIAYHNLGYVAAFVNDHNQANQYFNHAVDIYHALGSNAARLSNTYRYMAESYLAMGELENTRRQLALAYEMLPDGSPEARQVELILTSTKLMVQLSDFQAAAAVLSFLRDDEKIPESFREQAGDQIAAGPAGITLSRFGTLDQAFSFAKNQIDGGEGTPESPNHLWL